MCKICKKIFTCILIIYIVYLAIFIWYIFFLVFYWYELDCKFFTGYLKPRLNKLRGKKSYLLGYSNKDQNPSACIELKTWFLLYYKIKTYKIPNCLQFYKHDYVRGFF